MTALLNTSIGFAFAAGLVLVDRWRRSRGAGKTGAKRAVAHLASIAELQRLVASAEDEPTALMGSVLTHIQAVTGASGAVVEMIDGEEMVYRAAVGSLAGKVGLRLPKATTLSGRCAREKHLLHSDDAMNDPRTDRAACRSLGIGSMVLVPLHAGPRIVGVLKVTAREPHFFSGLEPHVLELMAGYIGAALARADMTEQVYRRQKAEVLAEQLQSLAQGIPQIVWTANPAGDLDYYNQNWFDYTGMNLEQTRGWGWKPVLHPDDLQNCLDRWTTAYQTGGRYEVEYRFKRASDGAYRWHLGRAAPVRDASGAIVKWFGTCTDIEDQKQSQALLRESEERYRSVIAASDALIWTNSAEGEMRGEQPGWAAYTGQSFEEYQSYGWAAAVHPDDRAPTVEAWKAAVAARSVFAFEHRVRRHDGEYRSFSIRAVPLFHGDGSIREWVGAHTDVHDQKRAAEERVQLLARERSEAGLRETNEKLSAANLALQTSEGRFRNVFQHSSIGVALLGADLRWERVNSALATILGSAEEELLGQKLDEICAEPGPGLLAELTSALAAGERQSGELELRCRHQSGRALWLLLTASLLPATAGEPLHYILQLQDVTEKKRLEDELNGFFTSSVDLLGASGFDGHWKRLSPVWERTLGWTLDELRARPWLEFVHPEDRQATIVEAKGLSEGKTTVSFENRYLCRDGSYRTIHWNAVPSTAHGVIFYVGRDVTQVRKDQTALSASLAEKEVLLKEIHHRVKNNLQVVSSLLKLHGKQITDPVARGAFQDSQDRVRAIALLHENLYQSKNLGSVSMAEYGKTLLHTLMRARGIGGNDAPAHASMDAPDVCLPVDIAVPCGLILNELVTNSLKHGFAKPGERPPAIRVAMRADGVHVTLSVSDNGSGLPAGFDLAETRTLGMHLVRMLARQLRATTTMTSAEGTHWTFRFPRDAAGEA